MCVCVCVEGCERAREGMIVLREVDGEVFLEG